MSFLCKVIIKQGSIVQPIAAVLDLNTDIVKDPSASTNPVTNQGFNIFYFLTDVLCMLECLSKLYIPLSPKLS